MTAPEAQEAHFEGFRDALYLLMGLGILDQRAVDETLNLYFGKSAEENV